MVTRRNISCIATLLMITATTVSAQGELNRTGIPAARSEAGSYGTIHVDASLVLIPVHATTEDGATIMDLTRGDFRVFEDGVEQQISYFAMDDAPISIGVLLDTSGSMRKKMRKASDAADRFFRTANPADEFFLIEFNEKPKLTVPFTTDTGQIYRRVTHAGPFGRTSLLDAVHLACTQMKNARNLRRAILIVSDGGDNHSHMTARQVRNDVLEADLQTYAIGIFDDSPDGKLAPEEINGPDLLRELSDETGGRHYRVDELDDLASVAERISTDLRNEYLLGYVSTNAVRDGKYRRVKVNVDSPLRKTCTYHRRGYYAPVE